MQALIHNQLILKVKSRDILVNYLGASP